MAIKHPYDVLKTEYAARLAAAKIVRTEEVERTAKRLLGNKALYRAVSEATGVPILWMAASFEREASSDFRRSPAQGDYWNRVSVHVPKGRGPFKSWEAAAIDAYKLKNMHKVGAANWTWELMCFYGELFNGFGYRDYHNMPTPYLWAGTDQQQRGKYVEDGKFDTRHFDTQLGIVPMMMRMQALDPTLAVPYAIVPAPSAAGIVVQPAPAGVGSLSDKDDVRWLQTALNKAGHGPVLVVDGIYGRNTWLAVRNYQIRRKLTVDGFAGPETFGDLKAMAGENA